MGKEPERINQRGRKSRNLGQCTDAFLVGIITLYASGYIHFNNQCLKNFSNKFYAPGESFEFGNIEVDQKAKD